MNKMRNSSGMPLNGTFCWLSQSSGKKAILAERTAVQHLYGLNVWTVDLPVFRCGFDLNGSTTTAMTWQSFKD